MGIIKYSRTVVKITPKVRETAKKMYGDNLAPLMLEAVKRFETPSTSSSSKIKRVLDSFKTHSKLTILLDTDKKGDFVLQAFRKVGKTMFKGKEVHVSLIRTLDTLKDFEKSLLESKEGILKKLNSYNFNRKFFKS